MLGEFSDDPHRYHDVRARKNYAGTSPIIPASGKKKSCCPLRPQQPTWVMRCTSEALSALSASLGARAYYDELRGRGIGHHGALRELSNRLVGILHGCLKTVTVYDELTAWGHHQKTNKLPDADGQV